ncbi:NAD(P)-binding domain-containing protein [Streptomyces ficellus]|uniref:NAD(P)-binding domain-containing protein n=1 Tax=Streptomyces ficellus TaxID=1977088 RepID=A0ABT7ZCY6_9ACTN|nr:NAD(P)-binding domain-containing protein [Streptomyces ficellus]MDN3297369.1 NAD(P)-binding domain-containing protein [Streptomyces ficellus]
MSKTASVTVIGLGPMGQAMAHAYLDRGYRVTVWNRAPARADALVARGAVRAASAGEALAANELVVLSLTDYDAMYAVLGGADPAALAGRVLVNLTSDTPDKARAAAAWAAERGATQLTGGVLTPPSGIGSPDSSTFYSGPREVFEAHRAALEVLSAADHKGEDPGLAALLYQLNMVMFWTALTSYWQAVAMAGAHGLKAADILPYAKNALDLTRFLEFYTPRVDAGDHTGDVDRLAMGVASVEHVLHTATDAGVDGALPAALLGIFRRGMAAGHGADSGSSLVEVLKRPAA